MNAEALKIADHEPFFGEQVLIGLVGRITPWKGQHIFLQAAASVAKSNPNVQFQIIGGALFGEEAYEVEMKELAKSLGIADQVEFTGHQKDIAGMMRNLDILVHASTSAEPFGQVIVQGMAAGRAVIATDGGGVPEIIVQGQTGLLVPMGDVEAIVVAIERLIHDPELGRRMGLAASERASQHFSIEATARKAEGLYLGL